MRPRNLFLFSYSLRKSDGYSDRVEEDQIMVIYLKNEFNVTAANFIKNLVFVGGPRAKHSVISIKVV